MCTIFMNGPWTKWPAPPSETVRKHARKLWNVPNFYWLDRPDEAAKALKSLWEDHPDDHVAGVYYATNTQEEGALSQSISLLDSLPLEVLNEENEIVALVNSHIARRRWCQSIEVGGVQYSSLSRFFREHGLLADASRHTGDYSKIPERTSERPINSRKIRTDTYFDEHGWPVLKAIYTQPSHTFDAWSSCIPMVVSHPGFTLWKPPKVANTNCSRPTLNVPGPASIRATVPWISLRRLTR